MTSLAAGQRVARRGATQQQVLGEQRLDVELGVVDREVDDGARRAGRRRAGGAASVVVRLDDDDPHLRVARPQARSSSCGTSQRAVVPMHAEADVAGDLVAARGHVGGDGVELALDAPGPVDDHLALLGEPAAWRGRRG